MEEANLFELTGHETGIVFNADGDFAMIQNWAKNAPVKAKQYHGEKTKSLVLMLLKDCREIDGDVTDDTTIGDIKKQTADNAIIFSDEDGIHFYITFINWN